MLHTTCYFGLQFGPIKAKKGRVTVIMVSSLFRGSAAYLFWIISMMTQLQYFNMSCRPFCHVYQRVWSLLPLNWPAVQRNMSFRPQLMLVQNGSDIVRIFHYRICENNRILMSILKAWTVLILKNQITKIFDVDNKLKILNRVPLPVSISFKWSDPLYACCKLCWFNTKPLTFKLLIKVFMAGRLQDSFACGIYRLLKIPRYIQVVAYILVVKLS